MFAQSFFSWFQITIRCMASLTGFDDRRPAERSMSLLSGVFHGPVPAGRVKDNFAKGTSRSRAGRRVSWSGIRSHHPVTTSFLIFAHFWLRNYYSPVLHRPWASFLRSSVTLCPSPCYKIFAPRFFLKMSDASLPAAWSGNGMNNDHPGCRLCSWGESHS